MTNKINMLYIIDFVSYLYSPRLYSKRCWQSLRPCRRRLTVLGQHGKMAVLYRSNWLIFNRRVTLAYLPNPPKRYVRISPFTWTGL